MAETSPQTTQLHQWLDRINTGDDKARDELLRGVCKRLEHLAHKMLKSFPNVGRWYQTDDVLQNTLLRLLRTLQQLKPESMRAFYGLAAQHIRRELLDLARKTSGPEGLAANHHSRGPGAESSMPSSWDPVDEADTPEELDRWRRFHEEVEKLPAEQREVVSLIFYHGWSQTQVAELFQVTDRTVRRRWQEALLALRAAMHGQLPSD